MPRFLWRLSALSLCVNIAPACSPAASGSAAGSPTATGNASTNILTDNYDFANGTRYPDPVGVSVGDAQFAPGSAFVDVPVTLDNKSANTVIVRLRTRNGGGRANEGVNYRKLDRYLVFRPGDPLTKTVRVELLNMRPGQFFELVIPETPQGAKKISGIARLSAVVNAKPAKPAGPERRAAVFAPKGTPTYDLSKMPLLWSDKGGPGSWSTSLAHGRTQVGNGETGYYIDPDMPTAFPEPPIIVDQGILTLHSQLLRTPIVEKGRAYPHGAAILSGRNTPVTQLRYGQYEWEAQMPDRKGAWPALWLGAKNGWPPEIDVYEGFGHSPSWDFTTDISANIHGGKGGKRSFTRMIRVDAKRAYGIGDLTAGYHRFAIDIQPATITWFIDGIETYQVRNPFPDTTWYPIMTVAVKKSAGIYEGGNGDMRVRNFRVWRQAD